MYRQRQGCQKLAWPGIYFHVHLDAWQWLIYTSFTGKHVPGEDGAMDATQKRIAEVPASGIDFSGNSVNRARSAIDRVQRTRPKIRGCKGIKELKKVARFVSLLFVHSDSLSPHPLRNWALNGQPAHYLWWCWWWRMGWLVSLINWFRIL